MGKSNWKSNENENFNNFGEIFLLTIFAKFESKFKFRENFRSNSKLFWTFVENSIFLCKVSINHFREIRNKSCENFRKTILRNSNKISQKWSIIFIYFLFWFFKNFKNIWPQELFDLNWSRKYEQMLVKLVELLNFPIKTSYTHSIC